MADVRIPGSEAKRRGRGWSFLENLLTSRGGSHSEAPNRGCRRGAREPYCWARASPGPLLRAPTAGRGRTRLMHVLPCADVGAPGSRPCFPPAELAPAPETRRTDGETDAGAQEAAGFQRRTWSRAGRAVPPAPPVPPSPHPRPGPTPTTFIKRRGDSTFRRTRPTAAGALARAGRPVP